MPIDLGPNALTQNTAAPRINKPVYLITLADGTGKTAAITYFIATDKPELSMSFVSVRGIFFDSSNDTVATDEEYIVSNFSKLVSKAPKEKIVEMIFPVHRIRSIRSLAFNAVKTIQPLPVGK
jgi:hypothetical protein